MPRFERVAIICIGLACVHAGITRADEDQYFDSAGIPIRFPLLRNGPPLVLVHGMRDTLESWQGAGIAQRLSKHFQVIAMDLRGHGRSGKPHDPESYGPELAADVLRLLRHIG